MDFLQIGLIFLIALLSIFLTITGIQVFFILRDLKKALDRLNKVLETSEDIAEDIEKPVHQASNLVSALGAGAKALKAVVKKDKPKSRHSQTWLGRSTSRRFYKKTL